jgi:phenylpropionate dioxygenase-like ring-hydroxylating dioxygenase large terminal subunit
MIKALDPILLNDWHPLLPSSKVEEGRIYSARLLGEDLIVWRNREKVNVWQDLCIHRGSRLSLGWIEKERVVCAYHGWEYDASGQCVRFPAHPDQNPPPTAHVKVYNSKERYGLIWASLGTPENEPPEFEEWDNTSYRKILCGPYHYKASATRAVENFLDVAHFPFVHEGLLGDKSKPEINDYEVKMDEKGIIATNVRVWQPDPDGTGVGKNVTYTYKVLRPFTAYLRKETEEGIFSIFATVTPVDELNSAAWLYLALNYASEKTDEELRKFQDKITSQDIPVVESQRPERLPLDLQAELHLKSDRIAIAYRKWLKQLGLRFGTI